MVYSRREETYSFLIGYFHEEVPNILNYLSHKQSSLCSSVCISLSVQEHFPHFESVFSVYVFRGREEGTGRESVSSHTSTYLVCLNLCVYYEGQSW